MRQNILDLISQEDSKVTNAIPMITLTNAPKLARLTGLPSDLRPTDTTLHSTPQQPYTLPTSPALLPARSPCRWH